MSNHLGFIKYAERTNGKIAGHISKNIGNGICFSIRPVKVDEKVRLKLTNSDRLSVIVFSSHDPTTFGNALPKFVFPDLESKSWLRFLSKKDSVQEHEIHYYYNRNGDVHFSINGGKKEVFSDVVDTKSPLWLIIEVYGKGITIKFLDQVIVLFQDSLPMQEELLRNVQLDTRNLSFQFFISAVTCACAMNALWNNGRGLELVHALFVELLFVK